MWQGCLLARSSCSNSRVLPSLVFLAHVISTNLAAGSPQLQWLGWGACQARGWSGPRAQQQTSVQRTPKKQARRGADSVPTPRLLFLGVGWAETHSAKIVAARIFHICNLSKRLIPGVQNVLAVAGGTSWWSAGPKPRGVVQRQALGVRSWKLRVRVENLQRCGNTKANLPTRLSNAQGRHRILALEHTRLFLDWLSAGGF